MQFPNKNVSIDFKDKEQVLVGINISADAMAPTLGSNGKTAMIQNSFMTPIIADDGGTVSRHISKLKNPFWDMGAKLVNERSEFTTREAGDGRATTAVLFKMLANESMIVLRDDHNAGVEIIEDLEAGTKEVVAQLSAMRRPVTNEELPRVAEIAALDKEAGDLIAETIIEVGKEGVVTVVESSKPGLSKEVVKGMKLDLGLGHPGMLTDYKKLLARLDNPSVIVADRKISTNKQLAPFMTDLTENAGVVDIIIFADAVEGEALASLLQSRKNGLNAAFVPTRELGIHKKDILEDICALTGAKLISEELGIKLEKATAEFAGSCESAQSGEHSTILIGGKGSKEAIEKRIEKIRAQLDATESEVEKEVLQKRLASLAGGVGVIRYGSYSPEESRKKRYKIEDAVQATKRALEEGVVPAGGIALYSIAQKMQSPVLKNALMAPFKRMCLNSGLDYRKVLISHPSYRNSLFKKIKYAFGFNIWDEVIVRNEAALVFDFKNKIWVNPFTVSLLDPMKVTRLAVENAVSGVKSFVSSDVFITDEPSDENNDGNE